MKTVKWAFAVALLATGCSGGAGAGGPAEAAGSADEAVVSAKYWSTIGCSTGHFDGTAIMTCTRLGPKVALPSAINIEAYSEKQEIAKRSAILYKETPTLAVYQGDLVGIYDSLSDPAVVGQQVVGAVTIEKKTNPPRGRFVAEYVLPCVQLKTCFELIVP